MGRGKSSGREAELRKDEFTCEQESGAEGTNSGQRTTERCKEVRAEYIIPSEEKKLERPSLESWVPQFLRPATRWQHQTRTVLLISVVSPGG